MDVEQMHAAASEEYKKNYSTGEYCHEQSFLWGFQEGVEFMKSEDNAPVGWVCPKCGRAYAPFVLCCDYCNNKAIIEQNTAK